MPTPTYVKIASMPAGAGTFTAIPQDFTHLRLVASVGEIRFNGDTGANYSQNWMYGDGANIFVKTFDNSTSGYLYFPSSAGHLTIVDIFGYTGSNHKTYIVRTFADNAGSGFSSLGTGTWRSTAAITSITTLNYNGPSAAVLYGIKAA